LSNILNTDTELQTVFGTKQCFELYKSEGVSLAPQAGDVYWRMMRAKQRLHWPLLGVASLFTAPLLSATGRMGAPS